MGEGIFLAVQHEEQEAPIGVHDDFMNEQLPSQQKHSQIFLPLYSIHPHMDQVEYYMSHIESSYRKNSTHDQWKEAKQANCQEKLLRNISCIRWPLWRNSTHLDVCLNPLMSCRDLSHWMCSHVPFGQSVITFPCWMRRHIFVFHACILGDNCDASFYCDQFRNPCLLDDSYIHWGCTWDSHLCQCNNKIVRFSVGVHQAHK